MLFARPFRTLGLMGLLAAAGLSNSDANAQQIFRIIGSDGRVTFSDKPSLEAKATAAPVVPLASSSGTSPLPFELRQVASRYPVTLYTAPGCGPCVPGRALLSNRGIPFAERTVTTSVDIEALKRLSGAAALPFLTIGGQQIKGFAEPEWVQFLDAAGYPKSSQLPASYTPSPAIPLVAAQEPVPAPQRAPAEPARAAAPAPTASPADNPAGIRF